MIIDENTINWIELNAKADASALRLKYAGDSQKSFAILQIECRRKAASKLKDTLACREFVFPTSLSAEQCTSDALADFHSSLVIGNSVLDMTAGLCIDAFHVARSGRTVTAIDMDERLTEAAMHNAKSLGIEDFEAINADSTEWLAGNDRKFDTIFIDPARRGEGGKRIFALSDCAPDVVVLLPMLKSRCSRIIVKASPMLDVSSVIASLGDNTRIYVTGTPTECKELLAVIDFDSPSSPAIEAVTISDNTVSRFAFTLQEEKEAVSAFSLPKKGMYLLEPYPAMMKSGGFSVLSSRLGVGKLDKNTHIYVSSSLREDFPGENFEIIEVLPFGKAAVKSIHEKYPVLNVTTRNFPMKAAELVKKLKIKEGGDLRLFAVRACGTPLLIIARNTIVS